VSRGHNEERRLKAQLEGEDWFVVRAAGSLGDADLVALKIGHLPRLIEVKTDIAGPFANFRPADRAELLLAAAIAGAEAWLYWRPPRGTGRWFAASEWPSARAAA
jgi:Holliday junction resolvase